MMNLNDLRRSAIRPDLADARFQGKVEAERFVEGAIARISVPLSPLRGTPSDDAAFTSEILKGEPVRVFEQSDDGWAWIQSERDDYVGWCRTDALAFGGTAPTHRVIAVRTFLYPGPDLKSPPLAQYSMGSDVTVVGEAQTRGTRYAILENGEAVVARHLSPLTQFDAESGFDFVTVAERFVEVPYLWGGKSANGVDCSGLVQLALFMAGIAAPRDSDMQEAELGRETARAPELPDDRRRGDLMFWKGHVGILTDAETLLHASGHAMSVVREPLIGAIGRIEKEFGLWTSIRRIESRT